MGTPAEIYHQPASAFVASFIGSMNFLDVTVRSRDGAQVGSMLCACLPHTLEVGQAAQLAIRPEAVALSREAGALKGEVVGNEFLGPFQRVSLRLAETDQTLIADVPSRDSSDLSLFVGQMLSIHLPAEAARLYPAGSSQQ